MSSHFFDLQTEKKNWIHCLPASVKLGSCLFMIGAISLTPLYLPAILFFSLLFLILTVFSQTQMSFIFKRLLLISPLCLFLVLTQVLMRHLSVFETTQIIFRAIFSMTSVILLISTTSIKSIIQTLATWGVPEIMITLFTFMFRFFFILHDELEKMLTNVRLRNGRVGLMATIHLYSRLLGLLFIRSYDRSQRVYDAMLMRGYGDGMLRESLSSDRAAQGEIASRMLAPLGDSQPLEGIAQDGLIRESLSLESLGQGGIASKMLAPLGDSQPLEGIAQDGMLRESLPSDSLPQDGLPQ